MVCIFSTVNLINKRIPVISLSFSVLAFSALTAWQLMPDVYMGPYNAWNPHVILEFLVIIFSISIAGKLAVQLLGARYGLLLTGLIGGFASSTATIHSMGALAKAQPQLADRAALGGVLSNIATLLQLLVLLELLAPQVLKLFLQPLCFGLTGMLAYSLRVLYFAKPITPSSVVAKEGLDIDLQSLLTITVLVCFVSYSSAALNAAYGQSGLWVGAALSGLVDAHAIVPTVAFLQTQSKLLLQDSLVPLLIALSANSLTKSLVALNSGGLGYAKKISAGVWITTFSVWIGYWLK
jgi:uncharacterized membrane protein (DUF4010 family)